ncbi:breast carcinoma amplified sequence 2 [Babesia caballi]|uniref:Breast carcinoma amplified sequence 2 n=1 Tax=Babesia caballi TaxID=5871 RepID=A0AAV4LU78_BABCB|nr:breast carcinoma amplified sequence 2 [Babesia caballi]
MGAPVAPSSGSDRPLYERNPYHNLVDSLSFVDAVPVELEGRIRELVAAEKRSLLEQHGGDEAALLDSYAAPLDPTPNHTGSGHLYHDDVARKAAGEPLNAIDTDRYVASGHREYSAEGLGHVRMLSEYAQGAQLNLELLDRYKEAVWLRHLEDLSALQQRLAREKSQLDSAIEQLNKDRKMSNIDWAGRLRSLSQEYDDYHQRNRKLLLAIERLQNSRPDSGVDI